MQTINQSGCINPDVTEDCDSDSSLDDSGLAATGSRVERPFTCTVCGYGITHEAGELQATVSATCLNCGDWTVQTADVETLLDAARDVAERLSGTILTERQALAYLLRDVVGVGRQIAAEAMNTTPSNVDNLHRRGREKATDARRIVEELQAL